MMNVGYYMCYVTLYKSYTKKNSKMHFGGKHVNC